MQSRVQNIESQMARMQSMMGDMNIDGASINSQKILELQREIAQLRSQSSKVYSKDPTLICGGLPTSISEKDAKEWLREKIAGITHVQPEIFCRGDYKGRVWAKFTDIGLRDNVSKTLGTSTLFHGSNPIWFNKDRPAEERCQLGLLYGVKKLLRS